MNLPLGIAGLLGLLAGTVLYWVSASLAQRLPIVLQGAVGATIAFLVLLLISIAEMPLMLFGLRHMALSKTTPRALLLGTFALFVMFAAVYGSIFVLITGQWALGWVLVALCLVRYAAGMVLR